MLFMLFMLHRLFAELAGQFAEVFFKALAEVGRIAVADEVADIV